MLAGIFENDYGYTPFQITMYLIGGACWFVSYSIVVHRVVFKDGFLEYPIMSVTANVIWEFLWGFVIGLQFGGVYLLTLWRVVFALDVFMFYTVLTKGKVQVSLPIIRKYYVPIMLIAITFWGAMIYSFYQSGADLPMGYNSGMILNVMMSTLCLLLFFKFPDKKFSFWAGFFRAIATDIFYTIYIADRSPDLWFPLITGFVSFVLDTLYVVLVYKRNKSLKQGK